MMRFGLKVHHSDVHDLLQLSPEALEFVLNEEDLSGKWAYSLDFNGPIVLHVPEKHSNGAIVDLSSDDEELRNKAMDIVKKTVHLAEMLNSELIVCHPGGIYKEPKETSPQNLLKSMKELKEYSGSSVNILLENMPEFYRNDGELWHVSVFKDWKEIRSVLQELKIGLCLDICHAKLYCNAKHLDFISYVTVLKPFIKHIHISDALGTSGEGIQIGDGEINFRELYRILNSLDVILVPEIDKGHQEHGHGFKAARNRLNRLGYISVVE
jgi:N-acetylneuraminate synthase